MTPFFGIVSVSISKLLELKVKVILYSGETRHDTKCSRYITSYRLVNRKLFT